jgi:hypothetical protein
METETLGEEDLFLMVNLTPAETGLPVIVWISMKGAARHDVRVKVSRGPRALPFAATLSVRPSIEVVEGALTPVEFARVRDWIELNKEVIIRHWDGDLEYSSDVLAALQPLS